MRHQQLEPSADVINHGSVVNAPHAHAQLGSSKTAVACRSASWLSFSLPDA
jgi:hypothetical protein